jgi:transcriptional regulator with XRE-family HTH domain
MCNIVDMQYDKVAMELVRALRGKRSQIQFARRLGYKSNVVYTWESGNCFPTAARFLAAAARTGIDVSAAVRRFYNQEPPWLAKVNPTTAEGVARLLTDLRGRTPISQLAEATGLSRFAIARYLRGTSEPRLPDFLRLLEGLSLRLLDFINVLFDPTTIASVATTWRDLEASRNAAYDAPWTLAVMRALELEDYKRLPQHVPGWIAARINISEAEENKCLKLLENGRQIRKVKSRWVAERTLTVDTRKDPGMGRALRKWWAQVAMQRIEQADKGIFSYNLCSVSQRDYERLQDLHRSCFRQVRAIVAQSAPVERVDSPNVEMDCEDMPPCIPYSSLINGYWPVNDCGGYGSPVSADTTSAVLGGKTVKQAVEDAFSVAETVQPNTARWLDGTETEVVLELDTPDQYCIRESGKSANIYFNSGARIRTTDGRILSNLIQNRLSVYTNAGSTPPKPSQTFLSLGTDQDWVRADQFETTSGIKGVDTSSSPKLQAGFVIDYEWSASVSTVSGFIVIEGETICPGSNDPSSCPSSDYSEYIVPVDCLYWPPSEVPAICKIQ